LVSPIKSPFLLVKSHEITEARAIHQVKPEKSPSDLAENDADRSVNNGEFMVVLW
jgi:hypothetical protein